MKKNKQLLRPNKVAAESTKMACGQMFIKINKFIFSSSQK